MFHGPGVVVVAFVPSAGPVPPPRIFVMPLLRALPTCCGEIMWTWVSTPPRGTVQLGIPPPLDPHRPSGAARLELEAPCARRLRERIATAGSVEGAADQSVSAGHDASAGEWDEIDLACVAGLEPDGGA